MFSGDHLNVGSGDSSFTVFLIRISNNKFGY